MALLKPISVVAREKTWRDMREAMATVQDTASDAAQSIQEQEEKIARWVKVSRQEHDARRS